MELSFSRGFSHGFLDGNNHKVLVRGDHAKKRGIFLGRGRRPSPARGIRLDLAAPVKPGDGLVFDGDEAAGVPEQGGRVYEVCSAAVGGRAAGRGLSAGPVELRFGRQRPRPAAGPARPAGLEDRRPRADPPPPQDVRRARRIAWSISTSTSAPGRRAAAARRRARRPAIARRGRVGDSRSPGPTSSPPTDDAAPRAARPARRHVYRLRDLTADDRGRAAGPQEPPQRAPPRPGRPARRGRRRSARPRDPRRRPGPPGPRVGLDRDPAAATRPGRARRSRCVLCRTHRAGRGGRRLRASDDLRRLPGHQAIQATPSPPPGAAGAADLPGHAPDPEALRGEPLPLPRRSRGPTASWSATPAGSAYCAERGIPFVADFSLNAANELTVELLKAAGRSRVTASYDLSVDQLDRPARGRPRPTGWRS